MNRRQFLKSIAAGVASVAISTKLATTRIDEVFEEKIVQPLVDNSVNIRARYTEAMAKAMAKSIDDAILYGVGTVKVEHKYGNSPVDVTDLPEIEYIEDWTN